MPRVTCCARARPPSQWPANKLAGATGAWAAATTFDRLPVRRAGIDTYQQPVVYMRSDCHVCRAEGFEAQTQVEVIDNGRHLLAILHHVSSDWLARDEIALSDVAWTTLRGGRRPRGSAASSGAGVVGPFARQGAWTAFHLRSLARADG